MEAYWKNEFARLEAEQERAAFLSKMEMEIALEAENKKAQEAKIESYDYFKDGRAYHVILQKATKTNPRQPYYLISYDIFEERSTAKAYATRDWSGEKYSYGKPALNRFKWIAKSICIEWNGGIFAPSWALSDAYFHNHEYGCSSRSKIVNI